MFIIFCAFRHRNCLILLLRMWDQTTYGDISYEEPGETQFNLEYSSLSVKLMIKPALMIGNGISFMSRQAVTEEVNNGILGVFDYSAALYLNFCLLLLLPPKKIKEAAQSCLLIHSGRFLFTCTQTKYSAIMCSIS